jgi:hypothetical protein
MDTIILLYCNTIPSLTLRAEGTIQYHRVVRSMNPLSEHAVSTRYHLQGSARSAVRQVNRVPSVGTSSVPYRWRFAWLDKNNNNVAAELFGTPTT